MHGYVVDTTTFVTDCTIDFQYSIFMDWKSAENHLCTYDMASTYLNTSRYTHHNLFGVGGSLSWNTCSPTATALITNFKSDNPRRLLAGHVITFCSSVFQCLESPFCPSLCASSWCNTLHRCMRQRNHRHSENTSD